MRKLRRASSTGKGLHFIILAALFASLTATGAYIRIPMYPVPITLQTLFVVLSGVFLGSPYGPISQLLYLGIGLIGFPVFAEGGGPAYIFKPTFGYLLGFPLGSFLSARILYGRSVPANLQEVRIRLGQMLPQRILFGLGAGILAIFVPGVVFFYLSSNLYLNNSIPFGTAITAGFLIFLPGDIIKITAMYFLIKMIALKNTQPLEAAGG